MDEQHFGQKLPGITPEIYSPKFSFIKGEITNGVVLWSQKESGKWSPAEKRNGRIL